MFQEVINWLLLPIDAGRSHLIDGLTSWHARLIVQLLASMFRGTKGGSTYPTADGSRRGDYYDMTLRRRVFEYTHKPSGYIALTYSVAAVLFGLWYVNAPNWMWACLIIWWALIVAAAYILQQQKRAMDPDLPGNKLKSIGLWVHER